MIRETLSHFNMPWLTCVGLILFLAVFTGAVLWVFRKESTRVYARLEQLPLQEDQS